MATESEDAILGHYVRLYEQAAAKRDELRRFWLRESEERMRLARELKQARSALVHQRRKSAQLRRERWEARQGG